MNPNTCFSKKLFGKNIHALHINVCAQIEALIISFHLKKKFDSPIHTTRVHIYLKRGRFLVYFWPNSTLTSLAKLSTDTLDLVHWHWQVNLVEKIGKYLLYLSKKSSFYFSDILLKSRILTQILGFFDNIFLINSIRAFECCMNCQTSIKKKKLRF